MLTALACRVALALRRRDHEAARARAWAECAGAGASAVRALALLRVPPPCEDPEVWWRAASLAQPGDVLPALEALRALRDCGVPPPPRGPGSEKLWVRTARLGSAAMLRALRDCGVPPPDGQAWARTALETGVPGVLRALLTFSAGSGHPDPERLWLDAPIEAVVGVLRRKGFPRVGLTEAVRHSVWQRAAASGRDAIADLVRAGFPHPDPTPLATGQVWATAAFTGATLHLPPGFPRPRSGRRSARRHMWELAAKRLRRFAAGPALPALLAETPFEELILVWRSCAAFPEALELLSQERVPVPLAAEDEAVAGVWAAAVSAYMPVHAVVALAKCGFPRPAQGACADGLWARAARRGPDLVRAMSRLSLPAPQGPWPPGLWRAAQTDARTFEYLAAREHRLYQPGGEGFLLAQLSWQEAVARAAAG